MFRALLCLSSGAHDYNVDYHIGRSWVAAGWKLGVVRLAIVCSPDTTPAYPHLTSNIQQPKKETTNVVINIIVVRS